MQFKKQLCQRDCAQLPKKTKFKHSASAKKVALMFGNDTKTQILRILK